jgi:hypothetical protein
MRKERWFGDWDTWVDDLDRREKVKAIDSSPLDKNLWVEGATNVNAILAVRRAFKLLEAGESFRVITSTKAMARMIRFGIETLARSNEPADDQEFGHMIGPYIGYHRVFHLENYVGWRGRGAGRFHWNTLGASNLILVYPEEFMQHGPDNDQDDDQDGDQDTSWSLAWPRDPGRPFTLENYKYEILPYAKNLSFFINCISDTNRRPYFLRDELPFNSFNFMRGSNRPTESGIFNSREEEMRFILDKIREEKLEDAMIVAPNNELAEEMYEFFKNEGVKVQAHFGEWCNGYHPNFNGVLDFHFDDPSLPFITTYNRANGLSFENVFIPFSGVRPGWVEAAITDCATKQVFMTTNADDVQTGTVYRDASREE